MLWNVFFHMKWYYVNNCPLERVSRGLFPWLLISWLPLSSNLKIQVSYYFCCCFLYLENSQPVALVLHITRKRVHCLGHLWMLFFRNHNWIFVSFSLKLQLSSSHARKSTCSVRTPHHIQSYSLSDSNASLTTQLKFLFPSDTFMFSVLWLVTTKGRSCHWLNWSIDFLSEVFWTIISHINKSLSLKLESGKEKCSKVESHTTCPPVLNVGMQYGTLQICRGRTCNNNNFYCILIFITQRENE